MLLAALDARTHGVEYTNAGHGPALHYIAAERRIVPLGATGLPLGVEEIPQFETPHTLAMQPGDVLLLCTDGIVESSDAAGQPFGMSRLESMIRDLAGRPASELVTAIGAAVSAHYEGDSPPDDLTILAARRLTACAAAPSAAASRGGNPRASG
jgi:serine phosphatase RsbU (regulator of sigma subunit)